MKWLLVLLAACAPVTWADVSVRPVVFDRGHDAWYVEIVEHRASGLELYHTGFICDDQPAELTIDRLCSEETVLTGEVWRMPDRSHCGAPPPVFPNRDVEAPGAVPVAMLRPRTIFRGSSLNLCETPAPETVSLWPPAAPMAGWRDDTYWTSPDDVPYELLTK
jgi:hypothetical protein